LKTNLVGKARPKNKEELKALVVSSPKENKAIL